jgi:mono/diheme cytochrome c family protein
VIQAAPAINALRARLDRTTVLFIGALCVTQCFAAFAQTKPPPLVIASTYGRDLYAFYCASCHGRDGKGEGPVASALKKAPPDLTMLSIHNGGVFPRARTQAIVIGDADPPLPAHGSREMPVWGPIFRGLDVNQAMNRQRIANILDFVESLQVRYAGPYTIAFNPVHCPAKRICGGNTRLAPCRYRLLTRREQWSEMQLTPRRVGRSG